MTPPPPGAHEGDRVHGIGLGILVGTLLGLAVGAVTLLIFVLARRDVAEDVVKLNPSFEAPRPVVLPSPIVSNVPPSVTPAEPIPATPPSVASTSPLAGATNVPENAEVVINFATPMDPTTLSIGTMSVFDARRGANVIGELLLTYRTEAKQLVIALPAGSAGWGSGNTIDVELSTQVKDATGTPLTQAFRMTFSTR